MIQVQQLSFAYGSRPVLADISLHLEPGRLVFLIGANGSGKTTLLRLLLGQLKPAAGSILLSGQDSRRMSPRQRAGHMSYIPQNHDYSYDFLVSDMVLMGKSRFYRWYQRPGKQDMAAMEDCLARLHIPHLRDRLFCTLSGGERQLVLLARALMQKAGTILMDEVSANLDLNHQLMVMKMARQLSLEGYLVLIATHQLEWAFRYGDSLLVTENGSITGFEDFNEDALLEMLCRVYACPLEKITLSGGRTLILPSAEALKLHHDDARRTP